MKREGRILGLTPVQVGLVFVAVTLAAGWALFQRAELATKVRDGAHISATFSRQYKLVPYHSKVKVVGVPVGVVTKVEPQRDGVKVRMKVDRQAADRLGARPSAAIRPATMLGGNSLSMFVDLRPGGARRPFRGVIPQSRTTIPVELDQVLDVLTTGPRAGLQAVVRELDESLAAGGAESLRGALAATAGSLTPATDVLQALQGKRSGDLAALVDGLAGAAGAATAGAGRLEAVLDHGATLAGTLDRRQDDLAAAIDRAPAALAQARATLGALDGTLDRLDVTLIGARPAVRRLGGLLERAGPVVAEARPVAAALRPLLADARPLLDRLGPTASVAERVLGDIEGPVLGRARGPILQAVLAPGPKSRDRLYQATAFMLSGLNGAGKIVDGNGHAVDFNAGLNEESTGGLPVGSPLAPQAPPRRSWRAR